MTKITRRKRTAITTTASTKLTPKGNRMLNALQGFDNASDPQTKDKHLARIMKDAGGLEQAYSFIGAMHVLLSAAGRWQFTSA